MGGGAAQDVTPAPDSGFNVRTRVHEYGGGELVLSSDAVYFSNFKASRGRNRDIVSRHAVRSQGDWHNVAALLSAYCPATTSLSARALRGHCVRGLKM